MSDDLLRWATDPRLLAGAVAVALALWSRRVILGHAHRLLGRWAAADKIDDVRAAKSLTREEQLQAQIDALVAARLEDMQAQLVALRDERDAYRSLALEVLAGGEVGRQAARRLADRELRRSVPGLPVSTLEELTSEPEEVVDDGA